MVMLPDNAPRFTPPPFQHGRVFILGVPYVPESADAKPVYKDGKLLAVCVGEVVCFPQEFVSSEIKKAIDGAWSDSDKLAAEARWSCILQGVILASSVWVLSLVAVNVYRAVAGVGQ